MNDLDCYNAESLYNTRWFHPWMNSGKTLSPEEFRNLPKAVREDFRLRLHQVLGKSARNACVGKALEDLKCALKTSEEEQYEPFIEYLDALICLRVNSCTKTFVDQIANVVIEFQKEVKPASDLSHSCVAVTKLASSEYNFDSDDSWIGRDQLQRKFEEECEKENVFADHEYVEIWKKHDLLDSHTRKVSEGVIALEKIISKIAEFSAWARWRHFYWYGRDGLNGRRDYGPAALNDDAFPDPEIYTEKKEKCIAAWDWFLDLIASSFVDLRKIASEEQCLKVVCVAYGLLQEELPTIREIDAFGIMWRNLFAAEMFEDEDQIELSPDECFLEYYKSAYVCKIYSSSDRIPLRSRCEQPSAEMSPEEFSKLRGQVKEDFRERMCSLHADQKKNEVVEHSLYWLRAELWRADQQDEPDKPEKRSVEDIKKDQIAVFGQYDEYMVAESIFDEHDQERLDRLVRSGQKWDTDYEESEEVSAQGEWQESVVSPFLEKVRDMNLWRTSVTDQFVAEVADAVFDLQKEYRPGKELSQYFVDVTKLASTEYEFYSDEGWVDSDLMQKTFEEECAKENMFSGHEYVDIWKKHRLRITHTTKVDEGVQALSKLLDKVIELRAKVAADAETVDMSRAEIAAERTKCCEELRDLALSSFADLCKIAPEARCVAVVGELHKLDYPWLSLE